MRIKDLITPNVCKSTVFENSWIWYCDNCRIHGVATDSAEAEFYAESHLQWTSYVSKKEVKKRDVLEGVEFNLDDEDETTFDFLDIKENKRNKYVWESVCEGAVFLISEKDNKTFDLGDDYTDTSPTIIEDLDKAIEIQKRLGLE